MVEGELHICHAHDPYPPQNKQMKENDVGVGVVTQSRGISTTGRGVAWVQGF